MGRHHAAAEKEKCWQMQRSPWSVLPWSSPYVEELGTLGGSFSVAGTVVQADQAGDGPRGARSTTCVPRDRLELRERGGFLAPQG
jgi:hypothetical protein